MTVDARKLRESALDLARRHIERWNPGRPVLLTCGEPWRRDIPKLPVTVAFDVAGWRRAEEARLAVDPESGDVLAFEDPEGRAGVAQAAVKLDAKAAADAVRATGLVPAGLAPAKCSLEPASPGAGLLWTLEYPGAKGALRFEVHPASGRIVGFARPGREGAPS